MNLEHRGLKFFPHTSTKRMASSCGANLQQQVGGADVMFELRNLAVPFVLLLAKNGMDYIKNKKTKTSTQPIRKSRPVTKQRGGCGCSANKPTLGGAQGELNTLANNLSSIMSSYMK